MVNRNGTVITNERMSNLKKRIGYFIVSCFLENFEELGELEDELAMLRKSEYIITGGRWFYDSFS
jgi:hypothetical protein